MFGDHELIVVGDEIFIDGEPATEYVFDMDYYFMLGDNRQNSSDSRFWGFVPEDHLVGKALMVAWSLDNSNGGFRSDRWFKSAE